MSEGLSYIGIEMSEENVEQIVKHLENCYLAARSEPDSAAISSAQQQSFPDTVFTCSECGKESNMELHINSSYGITLEQFLLLQSELKPVSHYE